MVGIFCKLQYSYGDSAALLNISPENILLQKNHSYMGTYIHRTIIVSGYEDVQLRQLHDNIREILGEFRLLVTPIFQGINTRFGTFYIVPCGLSLNDAAESDYSIIRGKLADIERLLHQELESVDYAYYEYGHDAGRLPRTISSSSDEFGLPA